MAVVSGYYKGDPHSQEIFRVNWHAVCNFTFKQFKKYICTPHKVHIQRVWGNPSLPTSI